jgi:ferric-dicitrate binding protein FerR (iron transport regulator)
MKSNRHINWNLAGRILSGEASDSENISFNKWLCEKDNQQEWKSILMEMEQVDYALTKEKINVDSAWELVNTRTINKNATLKKYLAYSAIAASIIIAFALFLNPFNNNVSTQQIVQTINTIEHVDLTDGSIIDINRHSTLSYPEQFNSKVRNVTLTGEAFFEVSKEKKRPFIIHTDNMNIRVLGTSFNIKAYPKSTINEVTVENGMVEVSSVNGMSKPIVLKAGDKAIFHTENNSLIKVTNNNSNFLSWKTKELIFKNEKLSNALSLIEEVYNVNILVPETIKTDELIISATFDKNTIEHIIQTLNSIHPIHLTYTSN